MLIAPIFTFLLLLRSTSSSWMMPSLQFLQGFSSKFSTVGIRIAMPEDNTNTLGILTQVKHFSKFGISVNAIGEAVDSSKGDLEQNPNILHVTTASVHNTRYLHESINFVSNKLRRTNTENGIWLIGISIPEGEAETSLVNLFQGVPLHLNSEVYVYNVETMVQYQIYEVYKIIDQGDAVIKQVASWSMESNYLNFVKEDKYSRRRNLRGAELSVTSMHSMPYVGITENETGDLQFYGGIFAEVFKELARSLNFSFTVTNPSDGEWGSLKDDGTWSGMVGQLETKKVDFAVTDFTVTEERSRVITFSTPLDQIYHAIIIQNPINTYHFEAYTSPFTTTTWSMLFAWIVATPPVLFIVSRYGELDKNINEFTFTKAFVMVSGTFTLRGYSHVPSTWKARIAFTSFLLGGLLCYFHWEAMLISYLAQRVIQIPFNNMQEFYESDYRLSTPPGTSNWDAFEFGNELWRRIHQNKLEPINEQERVEYLLKGDETAHYGNIYEFLSMQEFVDCKILAAPGKYDFKPYAIGYQKNSPYAGMFDYHIEEMRENGMLDNIKNKYSPPPQKCPDYSGKPLAFVNVFTAFVVGLLGLMISIGLFIMEMITAKYGTGGCKEMMNAYNYRIDQGIDVESKIVAVNDVNARRRKMFVDFGLD